MNLGKEKHNCENLHQEININKIKVEEKEGMISHLRQENNKYKSELDTMINQITHKLEYLDNKKCGSNEGLGHIKHLEGKVTDLVTEVNLLKHTNDDLLVNQKNTLLNMKCEVDRIYGVSEELKKSIHNKSIHTERIVHRAPSRSPAIRHSRITHRVNFVINLCYYFK